MSNLKEKLAKGGVTAVIVITILAVCYGLSWIVTCGIIKLITMCFGLTFKWSIATGIWLIICILRSVFNVTVKKQSRRKLTFLTKLETRRNKIVIESDGVMVTAQLRDTSKSENEWIIDTDIPIFKGEGREYVDRLVFIGEE